jgi:antitoxin component of MazEF toxin-antitoxin module
VKENKPAPQQKRADPTPSQSREKFSRNSGLPLPTYVLTVTTQMKTTELTVTRVGNSRGIRLPAEVLRRYRVGEKLIMEQRLEEIVLRPKRTRQQKLNWAETYQPMAQTDEDWSDWESPPEGLTAMPGDAGK